MGESEIKIAILPRGWVYVGRVSRDGERMTLTNAKNIRRWGTQTGLGQLAAEGPLANTFLDPAGTLHFHELNVIALLDVDDSKWVEALA